jgi:hypothetical protein
MKNSIARSLLYAALLCLATKAGAEDLTVNAILVAHKSGATVDGLLGMIQNPANTIAMAPGDLATLRSAGVPEPVLAALTARVTVPPPSAAPVQPDDLRLLEIVRLSKSGISESIVAEQVRQSGRGFKLSVTDLLYLKQNAIPESTIALLMATQDRAPDAPPAGVAGAAVPEELTFQDLVLVRPGFFKRVDRVARAPGQALSWVDGEDPKRNFEFQLNGLEKVWLTCQARTPENFCYQINFQIVEGGKYRFRDVNKESGSNASIVKVMEALRTYFPQLTYGPPDA